MWKRLQEWDSDLFIFFNSLGLEQYDSFWIFVTQIRHWIPLYFLFAILFFIAFTRKKAFLSVLFTVFTFATALGLTNLTKNTVARLRPNNTPALADMIRVLQTPTNYSFFSGHAAVSMAMTTFVVLVLRKKYKWAYVFYIWPLLFSTSRLYVGVHFPGDILVGAMVGVLVALFLYWSFKKVSARLGA